MIASQTQKMAVFRQLKLHFVPQERLVYIPAENSDDGLAKTIYTAKDRIYEQKRLLNLPLGAIQ